MNEKDSAPSPLEAGRLEAGGKRFGLVAARFHQGIVDRLLEGAIGCLREHGAAAEDLRVVRVPGAWEIPMALEEMAARERYDGLVALGVVIRGETSHFDYICAECARGVGGVTLRHRQPIGFGVLTCETKAQAEARAGGEAGNKGREAALAALEMVHLVADLRRGR